MLFGMTCFKPNMKTVCLWVKIVSRIIQNLSCTSVKPSFLAVILVMAGLVPGTGSRWVITAALQPGHGNGML